MLTGYLFFLLREFWSSSSHIYVVCGDFPMRNCKAKVPRRLSNLIGSLGMQDSMGPLKSLAIASAVNLAGDIFLCTVMGYGIAGAAWATMASQVCHSVVFSQYSICHTLKFQSIFFEVLFKL